MEGMSDYAHGTLAVLCYDDEECESFIEECENAGVWFTPFKISDLIEIDPIIRDGVAYCQGKWCPPEYYRARGIKVIEYSAVRESRPKIFDESQFIEMIST